MLGVEARRRRLRQHAATTVEGEAAARPEAAARGRPQQRGRLARICESRSSSTSSRGSDPSSPHVYGCRGCSKSEKTGARSTTLAPYITTISSAVSATTPRSWVMRTTAVPARRLELADETEDLRLRRHVERRRRLVRDQERGLVDERHRDHDALPHAARRTGADGRRSAFRARDADLAQPFDRPVARLPGRDVTVEQHRLHELAADAQHRVERRHRVLEDHRDLASPQGAQATLRRLEQVLAAEERLARRDRRCASSSRGGTPPSARRPRRPGRP